jgi:hypothetical protein
MEHAHVAAPSKLLLSLCWLQACGVIAAAGASFMHVESILGSGPAITFFGLVLAFIAVRRASMSLLLFGIAAPIVAGTIAILIWFFEWSPDQAERPVQVLLTLNAGVVLSWGIVTGVLTSRTQGFSSTAEPIRIHFSIRALLVVITFSSIAFAVLRVTKLGEMTMFAVYGVAVLGLSLAVAARFASRKPLVNNAASNRDGVASS